MPDRWGSAISLALYGVIFERDEIPHAARLARHLARGKDRATVDLLVREIEVELDEPTQRVADILEMAAPKTEEHLREFLRLFAAALREIAGEADDAPGSD